MARAAVDEPAADAQVRRAYGHAEPERRLGSESTVETAQLRVAGWSSEVEQA